ncbi:MAG TPA: tetratricopeptide repeat protein [Vicinamibacteria bacterium]
MLRVAAVRGDELADETRRCLEAPREQGIEPCRRALALGPRAERAELLRRSLAGRLGSLGRWEEAAAVYRESARVRPADGDAQLRAGSALLDGLNRAEEALPYLREAVRLKPSDGRAHGLLAFALADAGRFPDAVAEFEAALKLEPSYFERRPAARAAYEAARSGKRWP